MQLIAFHRHATCWSVSCVSLKCKSNNFWVVSCDSGNLQVVSYKLTSLWVAGVQCGYSQRWFHYKCENTIEELVSKEYPAEQQYILLLNF